MLTVAKSIMKSDPFTALQINSLRLCVAATTSLNKNAPFMRRTWCNLAKDRSFNKKTAYRLQSCKNNTK